MRATGTRRPLPKKAGTYLLDEQVGFILRKASQRHAAIFSSRIREDITPTRWAALAKLYEQGPMSQNLLGRKTAMDIATIKGVVDRLNKRGLIETQPDPKDGRRITISLTGTGRAVVEENLPRAFEITEETLNPLDTAEREQFIALLTKLT